MEANGSVAAFSIKRSGEATRLEKSILDEGHQCLVSQSPYGRIQRENCNSFLFHNLRDRVFIVFLF